MAQDYPQDVQDPAVATAVVDEVAQVVATTTDAVRKAAKVVEEEIIKTTATAIAATVEVAQVVVDEATTTADVDEVSEAVDE
ncbi:hypothetical protein Dimus_005189, partial [Dionaea muscipula]